MPVHDQSAIKANARSAAESTSKAGSREGMVSFIDNRPQGINQIQRKEKTEQSVLQQNTDVLPVTATHPVQRMPVVQRVTEAEIQKAVAELSAAGTIASPEDVEEVKSKLGDGLAKVPYKGFLAKLKSQVENAERFKKKDVKLKKKEDARGFEQLDRGIIARAEAAAQEIHFVRVKVSQAGIDPDGLWEKLAQACRSSTPEVCEQSLKGHLYELVSHYMELNNGAKLHNADKKADTLYTHPEQGLIATQNKWAVPGSMYGNIRAALRQLTGRSAEPPEDKAKEDKAEFEIPPPAATRVADIAVEGPPPAAGEGMYWFLRTVKEIYDSTCKDFRELQGRPNGIRVVFADTAGGQTVHFTFYTPDGMPGTLDLTEEPQVYPASVDSAEGPLVNMVLKVPEWAAAISLMGIDQRLALLRG
jgi:hypothetical protein